MKRALERGDNVGPVNIKVNRSHPGNVRPDSLDLNYEINGKPYRKKFTNQYGG